MDGHIQIKPGMIGFSNNKKGLLPKLIRFFTRSKFSHTFLVTNQLCGMNTVIEASELVQIVPFTRNYKDNPNETYRVYEINRDFYKPQELEWALTRCYVEFSGQRYGHFQLIWFVWAAIKKFFGFSIKNDKNWFTDGIICSELLYWFLWNLGDRFKFMFKDFNPDTIQAQDLLDIIESHPNIFILVGEKN